MSRVKPLKEWERYWRLTILWDCERRPVWKKWIFCRYEKCLCNCGNVCRVNKNNLIKWHTKSCWCLWNEHRLELANDAKKHWMRGSRIYTIYYNILSRCNNPKNDRYDYYWWRWIKCLRDSFEDFFNDMGPSYKDWLSIDRIDVNWNYCKDNCRWTDRKTQARNTRRNKYFEYNWETLTVPELYEKYNPKVLYKTFEARMYKYWWDIEKALDFNCK